MCVQTEETIKIYVQITRYGILINLVDLEQKH